MTRIENQVQYEWAVARVEELLPLVDEETSPDNSNYIELALLSSLVADYSDEHFAIGTPTLIDTIKLRMYEMKLSQRALAQLLSISPTRVNEIITGKKVPTYHIAQKISKQLDIDAAIVLGVC